VGGGFKRYLEKRYPGENFADLSTIDLRSYNPIVADLLIYMETICSAADALEICKFTTSWLAGAVDLATMAKLAFLVSGKEFDEETIISAVDRGWQIERAFSVREGINGDADLPSARFFEPINSGPHKGWQLDRKRFEELLQSYYEKRNWDQRGIPQWAKLINLGLEDVVGKMVKNF